MKTIEEVKDKLDHIGVGISDNPDLRRTQQELLGELVDAVRDLAEIMEYLVQTRPSQP